MENVESILSEKCELVRDRPVVVGVSGGPDSLCLMHLLHQAGYDIVVAHFNHKLRPESDAEANDVEQLAARLKLPFVSEGGDVRAYAAAQGMSIEEAARDLRYRFLFAQAHQLMAQAVAVGHTADDQVETVLMHLIRGTGLTGLKGMQYRTFLPSFGTEIPLLRPLLDVWREETRVYCTANGLHPHFDPSNDSFNFLRNRIRHLLIPTLETYNSKFRETIWRTTQSLNADYDFLREAVNAKWNECVLQEAEEYIILDMTLLSTYSVGLQRNLIRRTVERLQPGQEIGYVALERASAFIADPACTRTDLIAGLTLFREGNSLYIAKQTAGLPFDLWPQIPLHIDSLKVSLPGQTSISGGWKFSAERWGLPALAWEQSNKNEDRFQVWMDAEGLTDILELRVRRPGDVFEPLGMKGHFQKISDFFTNAKLPHRARERWPLLCFQDKVIWVPGYRPAESFKLKKSSRKVAYFSLTAPADKPNDESGSA